MSKSRRVLLEIYERQLENLIKLEDGDPEDWYIQLEELSDTARQIDEV